MRSSVWCSASWDSWRCPSSVLREPSSRREIAKRQILRSGEAGLACARWGAILDALWFTLVLIAIVVFNPLLAHGPTWIIIAAVGVSLFLVLMLRRRRA
jgi:hypothetical protein